MKPLVKLGLVAAAVVAIGGGTIAGSCACIVPIQNGGGGGGGGGVTSANIKVATTGNDGTCARHGSLTALASITDPCATFNKAYQIAQPGDIVAVLGGAYPPDVPAEGAAKILPDAGKTSSTDVTFACGDATGISFSAPGDQFVITAHHVTMQGGCFHFNNLWIGDGSNGVAADDVTIDGATMMNFDIAGSSNVTVTNSQIGPDVSCYAPGSGGKSCQNITSDNEAYFYLSGRPNENFNEPKIHTGAGLQPSNVTISNDAFTTFQSRDPDGDLHTGCLWIGYGAGGSATVTGNTFTGCMTYNIHVDAPPTPNLTITNNTFSPPKDGLRTGTDFTAICTLPCGGGGDWPEIQVKCVNSASWSGYTITGNIFVGASNESHGYNLDYGGCTGQTYPSLVINSNTLPNGATNNPSQPRP